MLPYTHLAARVRPGRVLAAALGLGLVGAAPLRTGPAVAVPIAAVPITCPVVAIATIATIAPVAIAPDASAADLVGIYRSTACTLTLDASGTYLSDCISDHAKHRYAIAGEQVVLEQSIRDAQRLTISGRGQLVAADGTTYSITGETR